MSCDEKVYAGEDIRIRLQLDPDGCAGIVDGDVSSSVVKITKPDGTKTEKAATLDGTDLLIVIPKAESSPAGVWKFQPWNTMKNGDLKKGRTSKMMVFEDME